MVLLIAPPVPIGTGALVQVIAECHSNPKRHGSRNGELDEQSALSASRANAPRTLTSYQLLSNSSRTTR
jgi:hypothetical protein